MVAGVRFELTTFGLCDLTQLSLRVGLYLHPGERDARHPVSTPSSFFRGLVRYCRTRSAGYEFDDHSLSPIDSVALTPMRHPKDPQKDLVLDPSWTLQIGVNP